MTLADRVEMAGGPDRALDAEIMFDLYAQPVGQREDGLPSGYLWPEDDSSWSFGIRFPGKDRDWFSRLGRRTDGETLLIERDGALVLMNDLRIPPLTASLDAAMSLVPERWIVAHLGQHAHLTKGRWMALLDDCMEVPSKGRSVSATPALALCAAAIRARATLGDAS